VAKTPPRRGAGTRGGRKPSPVESPSPPQQDVTQKSEGEDNHESSKTDTSTNGLGASAAGNNKTSKTEERISTNDKDQVYCLELLFKILLTNFPILMDLISVNTK